jgi:YD repeat-containing protein
MTSNRITLLVMIVVLLMNACKQDKEPTPQQPAKEEPKKSCLLERIVNQDGMVSTEVEFNNQGKEVKSTYFRSVSGKAEVSHYVNFEYDGSGRITRINQYGKDADAFYGGAVLDLPDYLTIVPEYDPAGKVLRMRAFTVSGLTTTAFRSIEYTYNGQGQLLQATTDKGGYRRFEYDTNGDIAKVYYKGEQVTSKEYLGADFPGYDDKSYMLVNNKARNLYVLYYGTPFTNHNITTAHYYREDGALIFTDKATYEYNEGGLPVKKVNVRIRNNVSDAPNSAAFQYKCQ